MNKKKPYNSKIHYEAEKRLRLLYSDKVLLERFNQIKKELIEEYQDKKEFIESLKAKLIIRVNAPI
jgi:hypothetical protein